MFHDDELEESEKFYVDQPRFLLLFYAMYNTLVARSEMVCYFVIILNHMVSASMITLVLPILIFLWAMLSVPRPSRRFWMMAIVYTEVGPTGNLPASCWGHSLQGGRPDSQIVSHRTVPSTDTLRHTNEYN